MRIAMDIDQPRQHQQARCVEAARPVRRARRHLPPIERQLAAPQRAIQQNLAAPQLPARHAQLSTTICIRPAA